MRQFLFLLSTACLFFLSFRACAQRAGEAYYNIAFASNNSFEPEFIDGLYMDTHNRKTTIKNIVEVKRNFPGGTPEAGTPDKKFTVINNQVVLIGVDRPQPADTTQAEIKATAPTEITGPVAPMEKEIRSDSSVTEVITEDPLPAEDEVIEPMITKYAEMISVDPAEITNYPLYHFIDKWYGTRYKWGGEDQDGIDCSAFSQKLYGSVYGIPIVRTAREQHKTCERIKNYEEASEGDLIFFRIHRFRISHVGVYLANGYFVHASRSKGVMISSLNKKYWQRRYASCGKISREEKSSESDFLQ